MSDGVDDLFRLFDSGRPALFSQDPNITPQESQPNLGPGGFYGASAYNLFVGVTNQERQVRQRIHQQDPGRVPQDINGPGEAEE